jgi:DNA damage-binding protein 1
MPCPTEIFSQLIPVPPNEPLGQDRRGETFLGGVLVVGGKEILLYEVASLQNQEKQMGKLKRLEAKKTSSDLAEASRAREKEQERTNRIRKPKVSIEWPWSELRAYVFILLTAESFLDILQGGPPLIKVIIVFCSAMHSGGWQCCHLMKPQRQ